jgi:hypothetical protein
MRRTGQGDAGHKNALLQHEEMRGPGMGMPGIRMPCYMAGKVEEWKNGRVEEWKGGRMGEWKIGSLNRIKIEA